MKRWNPYNRPALIVQARRYAKTGYDTPEREAIEDELDHLSAADSKSVEWFATGYREGSIAADHKAIENVERLERSVNWMIGTAIVCVVITGLVGYWLGGIHEHVKAEAYAQAVIQANGAKP
jgi:hypothetical protein